MLLILMLRGVTIVIRFIINLFLRCKETLGHGSPNLESKEKGAKWEKLSKTKDLSISIFFFHGNYGLN